VAYILPNIVWIKRLSLFFTASSSSIPVCVSLALRLICFYSHIKSKRNKEEIKYKMSGLWKKKYKKSTIIRKHRFIKKASLMHLIFKKKWQQEVEQWEFQASHHHLHVSGRMAAGPPPLLHSIWYVCAYFETNACNHLCRFYFIFCSFFLKKKKKRKIWNWAIKPRRRKK